MTIYWLKICVFAVFAYPSTFEALGSGISLAPGYKNWYQIMEFLRYVVVKTAWSYIRSLILSPPACDGARQ